MLKETPEPFHWRQTGRAKRWQPLGAVNLTGLSLLQVGTVFSLFWLTRELLKIITAFTNDLLVKLPYLEPFQPFYSDPTPFVLLALGILLSLSPWLLDGLLLFYGLQPLSTTTLSTYSPEALRVLQRYCRQRHWSLPTLRILPTSAPVALTYGNLPCNARIIISQGLLQHLADDEIATIYARCLGHIAHWDFVVMSLVLLVTQLPYTLYRQLSQWGDWIESKRHKHGQPLSDNEKKIGCYSYLLTFYFLPAGAIALLTYGVWYLLSKPALWLSRIRTYYSDRFAAELTGNPNALTRALLKIAQGIAQDIQHQGCTSWLLESLAMSTPVSYHQAITLGSLHSSTELESVLAWDCLNPYRYWLNINNTHPLMGDRLQRLNQIAHQWHIDTEINPLPLIPRGDPEFPPAAPAPLLPYSSTLLLQGAPFIGIALGFALGVLIWLVGAISALLGTNQVGWMYGDFWIIKGCLPIGFSVGTILRINSLFSDVEPSRVVTLSSSLSHLLTNPTALPISSEFVRLQGKLLGRQGISNWLGQDLILHSSTGLIKLHHLYLLRPISHLLPNHSVHGDDLVGQQMIVKGWLRRGATPWVDVADLHTELGKTSRSVHRIWSVLLASAAAFWGAYIIVWGRS